MMAVLVSASAALNSGSRLFSVETCSSVSEISCLVYSKSQLRANVHATSIPTFLHVPHQRRPLPRQHGPPLQEDPLAPLQQEPYYRQKKLTPKKNPMSCQIPDLQKNLSRQGLPLKIYQREWSTGQAQQLCRYAYFADERGSERIFAKDKDSAASTYYILQDVTC